MYHLVGLSRGSNEINQVILSRAAREYPEHELLKELQVEFASHLASRRRVGNVPVPMTIKVGRSNEYT